MNLQQRIRTDVLSTISRQWPRGFWDEFAAGTRQTYLDVFHQTKNDANILDEHRLESLQQSRHFRMEKLLRALAGKHGVSVSANLLVENNHHYVYATKGDVGITQAYVPAIGSMPQPAKFRERHAALNRIAAEPELDLGTTPIALLKRKQFYGLIAHNPTGKSFSEGDQSLGMIQLCVPFEGCTRWAAQITVHEILAEYGAAKSAKQADRGPKWKNNRDKRAEGE